MAKPVIYHIAACPFSQRVEILLALKQQLAAVTFEVIDITKPRPGWLLEKTPGTTALPVMVMERGVLKESLVLLRYLDEMFPLPRVLREDPYEQAVENMLVAMEGDFTAAGYRFVMNRDAARREAMREAMLAQYRRLEDFLNWQNPEGTFLFERFGFAECVFTPMFMRFWFLDYYEDFDLPAVGFERVRRWREACLAHPAAQQVSRESIVKLYYDYTLGKGNGALPEGRAKSSFALEPDWSQRPWPPRDKYGRAASDAELGLA
jgi:glutathione S-transferase